MENNFYKILLVDDDADILEFLSYNLKKEGFSVYTSTNGLDALQLAKKETPHLIILDLMMPEMDGFETCTEIRKIQALNNTIVAFLTARSEDISQITGFNTGADDYITKPVQPKVLISRIYALLKRYSKQDLFVKPENDVIPDAGIKLDREKFLVYCSGKEIVLARKEFALLELLISKPGKVFTRDEIYNSVWGNDVVVGDRTIDVHIRKLREKIGDNYIVTLKGIGYKFIDL